jgi:RNA polymerase sigma-70 factor, ECF subfamily
MDHTSTDIRESDFFEPFEIPDLYDAYQAKIFRYVLNRTGDVEAARDITAEVFFRAHKHRRRFRLTSAPISAWLFRIAGNEISSFHRKKKYRPVCLESALSSSDVVPLSLRGDLQEEILDAQEKVNLNATFFRVHAQLMKLPNKYQEVIVLHYLEEKTVLEIAAILGKKEGTVKSLISRGIRKLKKIVGMNRAPLSSELLLAEVRTEKEVNVL